MKTYCETFAEALQADRPDLYISTASKAKRRGLIFVDWLRNVEGATAVAAYSVRAKARAPVAMPIDWTELAKDVRFDYFNVRNVPALIEKRKRDPWARLTRVRQRIDDAMAAQLGVRAAATRR